MSADTSNTMAFSLCGESTQVTVLSRSESVTFARLLTVCNQDDSISAVWYDGLGVAGSLNHRRQLLVDRLGNPVPR